ncbi:hypothetical protein GTP58_03605 [Duganella sp. CY15W]|uniref:hypothetical protein n=1 Tax=Duganella sp. CY15W TaxID=2692172 RepID=UPI00136E202E|nr:hypothetical protein [Duganella sp. CY15W]MYM27407.1 hypothetical protein [Duganella sp. CY15W]
MKKIAKKLSLLAGHLLNVVIALVAVVYLFGAVVWMHVSLIPALLLTLAMALPFLGIAWVLLKLGKVVRE